MGPLARPLSLYLCIQGEIYSAINIQANEEAKLDLSALAECTASTV